MGAYKIMSEMDEDQNIMQIAPILLVNHQLRNETLEANNRLPNKNSCSLDIMVVNENYLWKTWLYRRAMTKRVDTVHVSFRIDWFSTYDQSGFRGGCGGPPRIVWGWYELLWQFLHSGRNFQDSNGTGKVVSIENLELDVITPNTSKWSIAPEGTTMCHKYSPTSLEVRRKKDNTDYVISPRWLLDEIKYYIRYLLRMDFYTAKYGGILYERIGKIRLFLDGELDEEIDFAKHIKEVRFTNSFGELPREGREEHFARWKRQALGRRIERGLTVLPDSVPAEDNIL